MCREHGTRVYFPGAVSTLAAIDADIVTLPEACHYEDSLKPFFAQNGFWSIFAPKAESAVPEYGSNGLALAVRSSRFKVLHNLLHNFPCEKGGPATNQWGTVTVLQDLSLPPAAPLLVVLGTHLKAKPAFAARRVFQVQQLLTLAQGVVAGFEAAAAASGSVPPTVRLVLMGDLNGDPAEVAFPQEEAHNMYATVLSHGLGFTSAYAEAQGAGLRASVQSSAASEPAFTTFKFRGPAGEAGKEKRKTIDYIMHAASADAASLQTAATLRLLSAEDIGPGGLPTRQCPSDHLPIGAVLTPAAKQASLKDSGPS